MFDKNTPILDLMGVSVKQVPNDDILTLGDVCVNALLSPLRGDEQQDSIQKMKCFNLAARIASASDLVDASIEELALLKNRIGRAYGALIVGRAFGLLDPSENKV